MASGVSTRVSVSPIQRTRSACSASEYSAKPRRTPQHVRTRRPSARDDTWLSSTGDEATANTRQPARANGSVLHPKPSAQIDGNVATAKHGSKVGLSHPDRCFSATEHPRVDRSKKGFVVLGDRWISTSDA